MKPFKFLSKVKYRADDNNPNVIRFENGETIWRVDELLFSGINRIQCGPLDIKQFRWSSNFDYEEIMGENMVSDIGYYAGPINNFFQHYELRRLHPFRDSILPEIPVIQRIEYRGIIFASDSLSFHNQNAYVHIRYKRFFNESV